ncbi:hypothetical protein K400107F7_18440 [Agathobaculum massiliense]
MINFRQEKSHIKQDETHSTNAMIPPNIFTLRFYIIPDVSKGGDNQFTALVMVGTEKLFQFIAYLGIF